MSLLQLIQIMIYDLIDVSICAVLVLIPFRQRLCSRQKICLLCTILYFFVVATRVISLAGLLSITLISVIRIIIYILLFQQAVRSEQPKRLFVLMVMLNYVSFIMILFHFLASFFFSDEFITNPYSLRFSLLMTGAFILCFPLIYWMMDVKIRPLMNSSENSKMWKYIWLVPATFCVIYHYNVIVNHGTMGFSSTWYNLIFSIVINAGSLLVTYLLIRLVEESNSNLDLKIENYQLAIQASQYEHLKNRIEETRIARHDLHHNMTLIKSYLDDCRYGELSNYIQQYISSQSLNTPILSCANYALNTVIGYYHEIASEHQIQLETSIQCPQTIGISDADLIVLLGNLLENSIEACCRQTDQPRFIKLWFSLEGDAIVLAIDNSYEGRMIKKDEGFLSSKNGFTGTGIISIKRIARKYHGVVNFEYEDSTFRTSVMLNP